MQKLLESFSDIKSVKVHRAALWILGEYSTTAHDIESVMSQVHYTLGEIPLVEAEMKIVAGEKSEEEQNQNSSSSNTNKLVTSDGTYASQSAFNSTQ